RAAKLCEAFFAKIGRTDRRLSLRQPLPAELPQGGLDAAHASEVPGPDGLVVAEEPPPGGQHRLAQLRIELGEHHVPAGEAPVPELPAEGTLLRLRLPDVLQPHNLVPVVEVE